MYTHLTEFDPNPVQRGFIMSQAKADLFSSRAGEGKSTGLAWAILYHTRHNPGAPWAVIRDTFENIQKTTMKTFFQWFPPGIYGSYNYTRKEFTWASGIADGTVTFIGMDNADDATKLLSWELGGIAMDEPAPAVGSGGIDEMVFDLGMTRLRAPGMKWYAMKLATNNPDESHWTYNKFVYPKIEGLDTKLWQPIIPENMHNLPDGYYEQMRKSLAHRPDLVRRFVDGEFGYSQEGRQVTPQWSDRLHLATGLVAIPRRELKLCWDFGLNPTCLITQVTPLGHWMFLESMVGDGLGVEELIEGVVKPLITERYPKHPLAHIGDPAGGNREQSSSQRSAVRSLKQLLGGTWRDGPQKWPERRDPLQAVLARTIGGRGVVQVDRDRAREVWFALRGGYHYHVSRTSIVSSIPEKNIYSHPGDAAGYGAAVLFPMGRSHKDRAIQPDRQQANYFGSGKKEGFRIGPGHGTIPPPHGTILRP